MPLYSRMGSYDVALLTRASERRPRRLVEYWAHVQALHAGRPVAGDAAPDGPLPRPPRQVGLRLRGRRAGAQPGRGGARGGRLDRSRPRRRAAAHQGALGLELVGDPPGPRLPLHVRGARGRRAQRAVRDPLRPARAGASRRGAGAADAVARGGPHRAGAAGGPFPRDRHGCATWPTTTGCRSPTRRRPPRGWWRPASCSRSRVRGLVAAGVPLRGGGAPPPGPGPHAAQSVRPGGLGAGTHRGAVRLLLSDRDLHARGEAGARLLRAAVPARRVPGRPGRPQGATGRRGRCSCAGRTPSPRAPADTAEELAAELWRLAGWLGLNDVVVEPRGDLAGALGAAMR